MSPILAILVLAPQSGAITFSSPGAPFIQVCKRLAAQNVLEIEPVGDLKDEVVALDVHEMPTKEFLDRLAHVLYAKATQKNGKWVIAIDSAGARERAANALKARIDHIKQAQAGLVARVKSEEAFDANKLVRRLNAYSKQYERTTNDDAGKGYVAFQQIQRDGPGSRAVRRLIAQLPAETLAQMAADETLVFSDQPRRYQAQLGDEARECIADATAEQNAWASAYQSDGTFEAKGWWYSGDPRANTDRVDPSKLRLFLKATMNADRNLPQFEAYFATADGIVLFDTHVDMESDANLPPADSSNPAAKESDLSLSPPGKNQVVAYRKGPHTPPDGVQGEPRNQILNPEKFEPLGGAVSEVLLTAAETKHKNLIACIPDESFNMMYTFGGDHGEMWPFRPSGVLATISKMSAQVEEDSNCILIRCSGIDGRTDRAALGHLVRQEDQDGCLRLAPLVQFAGLLKSDGWNSVAWQAVDPIVPNSLDVAEIPNWLPLRLLGHMSAEERTALEAGRSLRIDSLPDYVQEAVFRAVFYASRENIDFPRIPRQNAGRHLTLDREPTEVFPNGYSRDATVTLKATTSLAIAAVNPQGYVIPLSLNDFAMHNLAQKNTKFEEYDRLRGQNTPNVYIGHKTEYVLEWHLAPNITMSQTLADNDYNLRSKPVAANDLPDEYQKQVATETANLLKLGPGYFIGRGPTVAPPPR